MSKIAVLILTPLHTLLCRLLSTSCTLFILNGSWGDMIHHRHGLHQWEACFLQWNKIQFRLAHGPTMINIGLFYINRCIALMILWNITTTAYQLYRYNKCLFLGYYENVGTTQIHYPEHCNCLWFLYCNQLILFLASRPPMQLNLFTCVVPDHPTIT